MDNTEGEIEISHNSDQPDTSSPIEPPQPGQSVTPNAPAPPSTPVPSMPSSADLPTPHKPSDYVPSQPDVPETSQVVTSQPQLPDATNMFQPTAPPGPSANPGVVTSGGNGGMPLPGQQPVMFAPDAQPAALPPKRRGLQKPLVIGFVIALILGSSASAYYFGYYMNPSVVLSQSLSNTGKGYQKLVDYFDQQSQTHYKGAKGQGSYTVKSGSVSTDGNFSFITADNNSDTNFDVGVGTGRVKAEIRTIKPSTSTTPDIYLKASGIKSLGSLTNSPQIDSAISQYDDKWIAVDHTLLDNLGNLATLAAGSDATATKISGSGYPTEAQVVDELRAFGNVNQQYLFSTDKSKAVLVVTKKHGVETVDGHKAYHYTMSFNKANTKAYILAQQSALKSSKLYDWIKKEGAQKDVDQSFKDAADSTKDIKSSDTFELWADVKTRVVYKIRVADNSHNPATNYVDIGLDYKGGPSYPFFITDQTKDANTSGGGTVLLTLNSQTRTLGVKLTSQFKESSTSFSFNADLTFTPTNDVAKISAPTGAVPLSQLLSQLGYADLLSSLQSSASSGSITGNANDSKRQADINSLQTQLEAYFQQSGNYPSLGDMNDDSWLTQNMPDLDRSALQDPDGPNDGLVATLAAKAYAYQPTDDSGNSCEADDTQCSKYTLTATLSDGTTYQKANLD